jgi:hypothetical protein
MNREMENLLSTCLDQLEQGDSIEEIVARYPQQSAEIRPFLETAAQIAQLAAQPTIANQQQSRSRFLDEAAAMRAPQASSVPIWPGWRRLFMPVASLAVVLLLLGVSLFNVSASALPGDSLYPLKRTIEDWRLMRATDPQQIMELAEQFRQERLNEITLLLRDGREADVQFEGEIEALESANWIVSGLIVQINSETIIEGTPRVGETARIDGYTSAGSLFGRQISILTGRPDPEPEETPLPTILPIVETPEATPVELVPTPSSTPAAPLPTATPATSAPAPPSAGDDDGDNNAGEENDNGDDGNDNSDDNDDDGGSNDNDDDGSNDNDDDGSNDNDDGGNDDDESNDDDDGNDDNDDDGNDDNDDDSSDDNDDDGNDDNDDDGNDDNDDDGNDDDDDEDRDEDED